MPSNGTATLTVRLKEVTSDTWTNHCRTLTRTVNCAAPAHKHPVSGPLTALSPTTSFLNSAPAGGELFYRVQVVP